MLLKKSVIGESSSVVQAGAMASSRWQVPWGAGCVCFACITTCITTCVHPAIACALWVNDPTGAGSGLDLCHILRRTESLALAPLEHGNLLLLAGVLSI